MTDCVSDLLGFDSNAPIEDVYGCNGHGVLRSFQAYVFDSAGSSAYRAPEDGAAEPMDDFIPLFCVVNVYETDIAALTSAYMQSMVSKRRVPTYRRTSWSRNGVSSLVVPLYSPGRNKKKNAMAIIYEIACVSSWHDAP
jgi:hypothetical protein